MPWSTRSRAQCRFTDRESEGERLLVASWHLSVPMDDTGRSREQPLNRPDNAQSKDVRRLIGSSRLLDPHIQQTLPTLLTTRRNGKKSPSQGPTRSPPSSHRWRKTTAYYCKTTTRHARASSCCPCSRPTEGLFGHSHPNTQLQAMTVDCFNRHKRALTGTGSLLFHADAFQVHPPLQPMGCAVQITRTGRHHTDSTCQLHSIMGELSV